MTDAFTYYDRTSGKLMTDPIYAPAFLAWSYNTRLGRLATDLLFRQRFVSWLSGWFHRRLWSRRKIRGFVERLNVNMDESVRPLETFQTFNDFFTREIDLSRRPISADPGTCVAPADGRVLGYEGIDADSTFRIKSSTFNLRLFLGDDALADELTGGSMVVSRLYLSDYHHFHFPDSGFPGRSVPLRGKYYAVSPYARKWIVPFWNENHRVLTLFDSDHFGRIAMVEVGAFTVGSIRQLYRPGAVVAKGERKGYFEAGGSTVVLVFPPDAIRLCDDILVNTGEELETYVRMGESIGWRPQR